jgi:hypothetical protein
LPEGTEKNQEKYSLGWLDSQSRFKSGTFKIHASSVTTGHNSVSWRNINSHLADEALAAVDKQNNQQLWSHISILAVWPDLLFSKLSFFK